MYGTHWGYISHINLDYKTLVHNLRGSEFQKLWVDTEFALLILGTLENFKGGVDPQAPGTLYYSIADSYW